MARIRSKNTTPEMKVRRALHAAGVRFRIHDPRLPGKPDLVLPSRGLVIEVRGCFFHQHEDPACRRAHAPRSRTDYWRPKLAGNAARDRRTEAALRDRGWEVMVVWECDTRRPGYVEDLAAQVKAMPASRTRRRS